MQNIELYFNFPEARTKSIIRVNHGTIRVFLLTLKAKLLKIFKADRSLR